MKSPFAIFRKNQKVLMVVLTGMAMLAFIVLDPSIIGGATGGRTILMVLAGLLGAGVFWLMGRDSGKASSYAVVGAAIGLGVGWMTSSSFGEQPPVRTAMGDLSHDDMLQRKNRRNIANEFLRRAYEKVAPPPENPFMAQFWMRGLQSSQFGFGGDPDDEVILGFLLEQEAEEMGIQLSDDAVTKYILQATTINGKGLSKADFEQIRDEMRVSETQLYDAIRDELRCRLAFILAVPREITTPEQYWEDFRKLHVREQLDVAAIPVAEFTAEIDEPSPAELEAFFEKGKNTFIDNPARRSMLQAFGQPRRVRAAYLEADYVEVEKTIAAVTDEDVEKYYNENKEQFRNRSMPDLEGGDPFLPQPDAPTGKGGADGSPITPDVTPEGESTPGESGAAGSPAGEAPVKRESPADGKSTPKDPSEENKSDNNSGQAFKSSAAEGLLAQGPANSPAIARDLLLSALSEATESESENDKPAATTDAAAEGESASTKATEEAGTDQKTEPASSPTKSDEAAQANDGKRRPVEALRPLPEFKPLDETLRENIREQLLRERTLDEQQKKINAARDFMFGLNEKYTSKVTALDVNMSLEQIQEKKVQVAKELQPEFTTELTRYAEEHGLKYVETIPLSEAEFHYDADYAIARAIEPNFNEFSMSTPVTAALQLFRSPPDQLYFPFIATDRTDKWFAYWKIDDIAAHVPKFEDPGIREQVLAVWKSDQARPKAEERAKAVAELVRGSESSMSESLAGQTITGKPDGTSIVVVPTPPFSWLTVSTAPSTSLMPNRQPTLSVIPGVDNPDVRFMETVFDQMKVGDTNVVPNADGSVYYVVKVKNRTPSEASDFEAQRQAFLREDLFGGGALFGGASTYDYLIMPEQQAVRSDWIRLLHDKYRVQRNFSADGDAASASRPLGS